MRLGRHGLGAAWRPRSCGIAQLATLCLCVLASLPAWAADAEFLTVVQPVRHYDDTSISFVNINPARQSVVSCRCTMEVEVELLKTTEYPMRTLLMLVAEPSAGPAFANWSVAQLNFTAPDGVRFVRLPAMNGHVSGPGVEMRLSGRRLADSGEHRAYASDALVTVTSVDDGVQPSDVRVRIKASVLATTVAAQTVWGAVPAGGRCGTPGASRPSAPPLPPQLPPLPPSQPPVPPPPPSPPPSSPNPPLPLQPPSSPPTSPPSPPPWSPPPPPLSPPATPPFPPPTIPPPATPAPCPCGEVVLSGLDSAAGVSRVYDGVFSRVNESSYQAANGMHLFFVDGPPPQWVIGARVENGAAGLALVHSAQRCPTDAPQSWQFLGAQAPSITISCSSSASNRRLQLAPAIAPWLPPHLTLPPMPLAPLPPLQPPSTEYRVIAATYGAAHNVSFTACDLDGLPVSHTLPTTREGLPDSRFFSAEMRDLAGRSVAVPVMAPSDGRYTAEIVPDRLGRHSLSLFLGTSDDDREAATPLLGALVVIVSCPAWLVADPVTRTCTCDVGYEPVPPATHGQLVERCAQCKRGHFKGQMGSSPCTRCAAGTVQPRSGSSSCDKCTAGAFQPEEGQSRCEVCEGHTNSSDPFEACAICSANRYRESVEVAASAESCGPCPGGVGCPYGSTLLQTLRLRPGTWRISNESLAIEHCAGYEAFGSCSEHGTAECEAALARTPCSGGSDAGVELGDGYCRTGHSGPLCEVCASPQQYFDWVNAECTNCKAAKEYLLRYAIILGVPGLVWGSTALARHRSARVQRLMESLRSAWKLRISSRLKLLIGFVQVAAPLGEVYSITMPEIFRSFLRGMQSLYIDVFGNLFVPTACLGGLFNLLLLKAVVPIGVLLLLWVGLFGTRVRHEAGHALWRSARRSLRELLPAILWVLIIFCTSVSASSFSAFHCRRFIVDGSRRSREFLHASLDIECEANNAHYELRALAYAVIVIWPIGCLVGLAALFVAIRKTVLSRTPDKWSRASLVLTADFKAEFYWREWLELLRRLLLTGFVLAIPPSRSPSCGWLSLSS